MNWTGGKLHRHSKANANPLARAQKQHFARARLQAQRPRPARPSLNFSFVGNPAVPSHHHTERERASQPGPLESPSKRSRPNPHAVHPKANWPFYSPESVATPAQNPSPSRGVARRQNGQTRTLENVKQELLEISDWVSAHATKPARLRFTPAEEMAQIGRRRRLTVEDRERKKKAKYEPQVYNEILQPFERDRYEKAPARDSARDISIRMGSNIHQTQPSHRPTSHIEPTRSVQSSATESMILETYEEILSHSPPKSTLDCRGLVTKLIRGPDNPISSESNGVVLPLDKVRDLQSFDEVKARSASLSTSMSSSQTRPQGSHHSVKRGTDRTPSRLRGDFAGVMRQRSDGQVVEANDRLVQLRRPLQGQSEGALLGKCAQSEEHGLCVTSDPTQGFVPSNATERQLTIDNRNALDAYRFGNVDTGGTGDRYNVDLSELEARLPRFTFDRQVAVETENGNGRENSGNIPAVLPAANRPANDGFSRRSVATSLHDSSPVGVIQDQSATSGNLQGLRAYPSDYQRQPPTQQDSRYSSNLAQSCAPLRRHSRVREASSALEVSRNDQAAQFGFEWKKPSQVFAASSPDQTRLHPDQLRPPTEEQEPGENERWMMFVFPEEYQRIQDCFRFAPGPKLSTRLLSQDKSRKHSPNVHSSLPSEWPESEFLSSSKSPARTFLTSANTALFRRRDITPPQRLHEALPSETDFLTQLSPMEGIIDERLEGLSVHNNAARTVRNLITTPSQITGDQVWPDLARQERPKRNKQAAKRKLDAAFGNHMPLWSTPAQRQKTIHTPHHSYEQGVLQDHQQECTPRGLRQMSSNLLKPTSNPSQNSRSKKPSISDKTSVISHHTGFPRSQHSYTQTSSPFKTNVNASSRSGDHLEQNSDISLHNSDRVSLHSAMSRHSNTTSADHPRAVFTNIHANLPRARQSNKKIDSHPVKSRQDLGRLLVPDPPAPRPNPGSRQHFRRVIDDFKHSAGL